jgi:hypothetical protein
VEAARAARETTLTSGHYRCGLCRFWHVGNGTVPEEEIILIREVASVIGAALKPADLLALIAAWAPAPGRPRRSGRRESMPGALTQTLGDVWPGDGGRQ